MVRKSDSAASCLLMIGLLVLICALKIYYLPNVGLINFTNGVMTGHIGKEKQVRVAEKWRLNHTKPQLIKRRQPPQITTDIFEQLKSGVFSRNDSHQCEALLIGWEQSTERFSLLYHDKRAELNLFLAEHGGAGTGHVGKKARQEIFFYHLMYTRFIKTICETGFNAGHSSLIWLAAKNNTSVYSFEMGGFKYSKHIADMFAESFPSRFHIVWGDSKVTIPKFTKENPDVKCDLFFIDGGHMYPEVKADLINLRAHAAQKHIMISDDYGLPSTEVKKAWDEEVKEGRVKEYFNCKSTVGYPWALGIGEYTI